MDLVDVFLNYCTTNNLAFIYGNKNVINLLDNRNNLEPNKIYIALDFFKRDSTLSESRNISMGYKSNITFFILKNSDLDMPVYNEVGNNKAQSKFELNVKPLIVVFENIKKHFSCLENFSIENCDWMDVYNLLDQNKDGIVCNMKISYDK